MGVYACAHRYHYPVCIPIHAEEPVCRKEFPHILLLLRNRIILLLWFSFRWFLLFSILLCQAPYSLHQLLNRAEEVFAEPFA